MRIESVRIKGYRSLADLDFRPKPFTVLLGPNNSGKSNIVDALDFIADVYRSGVRLAIDRKGGFHNISFREDGVPVRDISIEVQASTTFEEASSLLLDSVYQEIHPRLSIDSSDAICFRHSYTLHGEGEDLISDYSATSEEIEVWQDGPERLRLMFASRRNGQSRLEVVPSIADQRFIFPFFVTEKFDILEGLVQDVSSPIDLMMERLRLFSPLVQEFAAYLMRTRTYQLVPPECRWPASPTPVAALSVHGGNLPAVIYHLQKEAQWSWARVMQRMALIVPELETIEVKSTPDRLWTLQFRESGVGREWSANEVSDGTIRALALFATVYEPLSGLLAIEEPENSVHPWVLRVFLEACREMAEDGSKQVLVTTHSPVLIDQLDPSEIVIAWRQEGRTRVRSLTDIDPNVRNAWAHGRTALFDLLDSGLLREAVPTAVR